MIMGRPLGFGSTSRKPMDEPGQTVQWKPNPIGKLLGGMKDRQIETLKPSLIAIAAEIKIMTSP